MICAGERSSENSSGRSRVVEARRRRHHHQVMRSSHATLVRRNSGAWEPTPSKAPAMSMIRCGFCRTSGDRSCINMLTHRATSPTDRWALKRPMAHPLGQFDHNRSAHITSTESEILGFLACVGLPDLGRSRLSLRSVGR